MIATGVQVRYRYRCTPTGQQRQRLAQRFGCVRFVWNDALRLCQQSATLVVYPDRSREPSDRAGGLKCVWIAQEPSP